MEEKVSHDLYKSSDHGDVCGAGECTPPWRVPAGIAPIDHVAVWRGEAWKALYEGLDAQIATGQVDTETNQACPALDSVV